VLETEATCVHGHASDEDGVVQDQWLLGEMGEEGLGHGGELIVHVAAAPQVPPKKWFGRVSGSEESKSEA